MSAARLNIALLALAIIGVGVGVGWWIHPGAGITISALALGAYALLVDDGKPPPVNDDRIRRRFR